MSQVNDATKKTICQHLNEAEREIIERQLTLGTPKKQIARLLGRNISTIRREIKRGSVTQRKTKPYISKHADDSGYTESECYFLMWGSGGTNRIACTVEGSTAIRNVGNSYSLSRTRYSLKSGRRTELWQRQKGRDCLRISFQL